MFLIAEKAAARALAAFPWLFFFFCCFRASTGAFKGSLLVTAPIATDVMTIVSGLPAKRLSACLNRLNQLSTLTTALGEPLVDY